MTPANDRQVRFSKLFAELSTRIYAYARRHGDAAVAEDVVSETFTVAWRKYDDVPLENPLPWLIAVARNILRNQGRSVIRDDQLAVAWAVIAPTSHGSADEHVVERRTLFDAIASLTEREREAVLLVAWDGLTAAQAATAVGCSQKAFEVRLARGRARLTRTLAADDDDYDPVEPRISYLHAEPLTRKAM